MGNKRESLAPVSLQELSPSEPIVYVRELLVRENFY